MDTVCTVCHITYDYFFDIMTLELWSSCIC